MLSNIRRHRDAAEYLLLKRVPQLADQWLSAVLDARPDDVTSFSAAWFQALKAPSGTVTPTQPPDDSDPMHIATAAAAPPQQTTAHPSRRGAGSQANDEDITVSPMRPFHESTFSYLFTDTSLPEDCSFDTIAQSLPEVDDVHARWMDTQPVIAVPVRAMWETRQNFDFSDFADPATRAQAFTPLADGRWAPRLRPSERPAGRFAADCVPQRAAWFYTTNAVYHQLNAAIVNDDVPPHYVLYTKALLRAFDAGLPEPVLTSRGSFPMTPAAFNAYRVHHCQRLPKFVSTSRDAPFAADYVLRFEIPAKCRGALDLRGISEYADEAEVLLAPYTVVRCVGKAAATRGGVLDFRVVADAGEWALRHEALGGALFIQGRATASPDVRQTLAPWKVQATDIREGIRGFVTLLARVGSALAAGTAEGACVGADVPGLAPHCPMADLLEAMAPDARADCSRLFRDLAAREDDVRAAALARWDDALDVCAGDALKAAAMMYTVTFGTNQCPLRVLRSGQCVGCAGDTDLLQFSLFRLVNTLLRACAAGLTSPLLAPVLPWAEAMRLFMATNPMRPDGFASAAPGSARRELLVYRHTRVPLSRAQVANSLASFLSTSTDYNASAAFGDQDGAGTAIALTFPLTAAGGVDMSLVSAYPHEKEVTFFAGSALLEGPTRISREEFARGPPFPTAATTTQRDQEAAGGCFYMRCGGIKPHDVAWSSLG